MLNVEWCKILIMSKLTKFKMSIISIQLLKEIVQLNIKKTQSNEG